MVGRDQCVVETIGDAVINCYAPQRNEPVIESVTVFFGQNVNSSVGQLEYITSSNTAAIAGGVTGGVALILILLLIFSAILYCFLSSISKYKHELEHAQQPVYVFVPVPAQSGEIEMNSNIGYLKSAGIGSLPPVEEVEHIYDELAPL